MINKKILLILLLLFIPIIASAETCDSSKVVVDSITMEEKTDTVIENSPATATDKKIKFDIVMSDAGGSIKYKVVVKNTSSVDYEIDENSFELDSDYLDYSLVFEDESNIVKANSTKTFYITIKYVKEIPYYETNKGIYNDNNTTTVNLVNDSVVNNPETGVNSYLSIIVFVSVLCFITYILVSKKKYNRLIIIILSLSLLIPISINAICKCDITIESKVTIVNELGIGDEIAFGSEHFYVVNTNDNKTLLLAKYNLLVGFDVEYSFDEYDRETLIKTYNESDPGYGLQNSKADGFDWTTDYRTAVVAFSSTNYWDDGDGNLLSPYNANGVAYYGNPSPYIYNKNLKDVEQIQDNNAVYPKIQDNGYTIAYYVENYVAKLKEIGAPSTIEGRLLSYEEAMELKEIEAKYEIKDIDVCITHSKEILITDFYNSQEEAEYASIEWCNGRDVDGLTIGKLVAAGGLEKYYDEVGITNVQGATHWASTSYWFGSAFDSRSAWGAHKYGGIEFYYAESAYRLGVRPVIEIDTSYLK